MDAFLIKHGAPTLAGLKCASLFDLPYGSRRALGQMVAEENRRLNPRGLYVAVLRVRERRALVLLYRRRELEELLSRAAERTFLQALGYGPTLGECLRELRRRLAGEASFPHEIGLLLGYPLEDVKGFMADCRGKNSKCTGCWKVYGDEDGARLRFSMYKTCTAAYCSLYLSGRSLEQLVVPA